MTNPANPVFTNVTPTPLDSSTEPVMRFFRYTHLPPALQEASKPFAELAQLLFDTLPRSAERAVALRKLLESKDAAVRAALPLD